MQCTILIVEDDESFAYLFREQLQDHGYQVLRAEDGLEGVQMLERHRPDLVLLDVMMPHMDGWEACRSIRTFSNIPIIMLTAKRSEEDRVQGLELGADDYVAKPFGLAELLARIEAVLRRSEPSMTGSIAESIVEIDDRLSIDRMHRRVLVEGQEVDLSPTEFKLLDCFLDRPVQVLASQALLTQVWGWEYADEIGYLRTYIYHLRQKIEKDPQNPQYILTEPGKGYRFKG